MVSKKTVESIHEILVRHVPDPGTRRRLLEGLAEVPGNRSFTDPMKALLQEATGRKGDG